MLAATLSLSMAPATALAEAGSGAQGGAVATAAAGTVQTPDGFYVERDKAYRSPPRLRPQAVVRWARAW